MASRTRRPHRRRAYNITNKVRNCKQIKSEPTSFYFIVFSSLYNG